MCCEGTYKNIGDDLKYRRCGCSPCVLPRRADRQKRRCADFYLAESADDDLYSWSLYSRDCFRVTKHRVFEQDMGGWSARAKPRSSSCLHHSMGTRTARAQGEPFASYRLDERYRTPRRRLAIGGTARAWRPDVHWREGHSDEYDESRWEEHEGETDE
jgi:hypothetical protein